MKKLLSVVMLLMTFSSSYAQKDVTQFLGIPIDGTKSEMIAKLKEKGFVSSDFDKEVLTGEFDGRDVNIYVVTNNNKVYRIMVVDQDLSSEGDIKIRYNNLCHQFGNNSKYITGWESRIADDIDISYEMRVNNNQFQAIYFQKPVDDISLLEAIEAFEQKLLAKDDLEFMFDYFGKKTVWFFIDEYSYNKYRIMICYDNVYNQANGEDL